MTSLLHEAKNAIQSRNLETIVNLLDTKGTHIPDKLKIELQQLRTELETDKPVTGEDSEKKEKKSPQPKNSKADQTKPQGRVAPPRPVSPRRSGTQLGRGRGTPRGRGRGGPVRGRGGRLLPGRNASLPVNTGSPKSPRTGARPISPKKARPPRASEPPRPNSPSNKEPRSSGSEPQRPNLSGIRPASPSSPKQKTILEQIGEREETKVKKQQDNLENTRKMLHSAFQSNNIETIKTAITTAEEQGLAPADIVIAKETLASLERQQKQQKEKEPGEGERENVGTADKQKQESITEAVNLRISSALPPLPKFTKPKKPQVPVALIKGQGQEEKEESIVTYKQGWLNKKSKRGGWKMRWFAVMPDLSIRYFLDYNLKKNELRGAIYMHTGYMILKFSQKKHKYGIKLVPPDKKIRPITLEAPNKKEASEWLDELHAVIKAKPYFTKKKIFTDKQLQMVTTPKDHPVGLKSLMAQALEEPTVISAPIPQPHIQRTPQEQQAMLQQHILAMQGQGQIPSQGQYQGHQPPAQPMYPQPQEMDPNHPLNLDLDEGDEMNEFHNEDFSTPAQISPFTQALQNRIASQKANPRPQVASPKSPRVDGGGLDKELSTLMAEKMHQIAAVLVQDDDDEEEQEVQDWSGDDE